MKDKSSAENQRDIVGIRLRDEIHVLTNETEFIKLMTGNRGSSKWKEMDYIQMMTIFEFPNEKYFFYEFNVFEYTIGNKFPLDYISILKSINLTEYDEFQRACVSIIFHAAEAITKIAHREILYMKCDFTRDTFGYIWLNYIYHIKSRVTQVNIEEIELAKKIALVNQYAQEALNSELDQYESSKTNTDCTEINKIYSSMQQDLQVTLKKMNFSFDESASPDLSEIHTAFQSLQRSPFKSNSKNVYILS
jgi:hypothetical protein